MEIKTLIVGDLQTNCFIIRPGQTKEAVVIDPGGDAGAVIGALKGQGISPKYIVLTHGHGDHIGGVAEFKKAFPSAAVCIHKLDAPMLEDPAKNLSMMLGQDIKAPRADRVLAEGDRIELGPAGKPPLLALEVLPLPGHTPGGICLLCRDDKPFVVFCGDTLFEGGIGRTDFPGGSHKKLLDGIREKLLTLPDDTRVYPGHGAPTTIGREKKTNPFL